MALEAGIVIVWKVEYDDAAGALAVGAGAEASADEGDEGAASAAG